MHVYTHTPHIFIHSYTDEHFGQFSPVAQLCPTLCDEHLGRFYALAIVNSADVNIRCMYLFGFELFSFLDICPGVGLLDHVTKTYFVFSFLRNLHIVLHIGCTKSIGGIPLSRPSPEFTICRFSDDGQCEVIPIVH